MSKQLTFYTVCMKPGYPIKYIAPGDGYKVQFFALHSFSDPGEAGQEFKAWLGESQEYCYLDAETFTRKVVAFTKQRKEQAEKDRERKAKWEAMTGGKSS